MKMFDEAKPRTTDAAALLLALFREFKVMPAEIGSKAISPSGLACQVACAWKLTGAPVTAQKESFQSRCFADAGTDRHARIQEFLSQTEYWVDIEDYIKEKQLPLEVVVHDGYEVLLWSEEYQCRFKCDGMLKIEGQYYVLEIKTERQQANSFRVGPEEKHRLQGLAYTLLLNTDLIMWVYEGRDFLEQKPFVQQVQPNEKAFISDYLKTIIEYKDSPEKLAKNEKGCAYCNYKNYCKMYFKELKKKEAGVCQKQ